MVFHRIFLYDAHLEAILEILNVTRNLLENTERGNNTTVQLIERDLDPQFFQKVKKLRRAIWDNSRRKKNDYLLTHEELETLNNAATLLSWEYNSGEMCLKIEPLLNSIRYVLKDNGIVTNL